MLHCFYRILKWNKQQLENVHSTSTPYKHCQKIKSSALVSSMRKVALNFPLLVAGSYIQDHHVHFPMQLPLSCFQFGAGYLHKCYPQTDSFIWNSTNINDYLTIWPMEEIREEVVMGDQIDKSWRDFSPFQISKHRETSVVFYRHNYVSKYQMKAIPNSVDIESYTSLQRAKIKSVLTVTGNQTSLLYFLTFLQSEHKTATFKTFSSSSMTGKLIESFETQKLVQSFHTQHKSRPEYTALYAKLQGNQTRDFLSVLWGWPSWCPCLHQIRLTDTRQHSRLEMATLTTVNYD